MTSRPTSYVIGKTALVLALAMVAVAAGCDDGPEGRFIKVTSTDQFQSMVLRSPKPVMVEFYKSGCPGCAVSHPNIEAVSEALVFAAKAGADPAKVREALMGGFASSKILEVHGERMIKRTFDPGFRIELHQKDLSLALSGARALNMSLPNTATAMQLFNTCTAHGGAGWDHSAMVRALEIMADHEVA